MQAAFGSPIGRETAADVANFATGGSSPLSTRSPRSDEVRPRRHRVTGRGPRTRPRSPRPRASRSPPSGDATARGRSRWRPSTARRRSQRHRRVPRRGGRCRVLRCRRTSRRRSRPGPPRAGKHLLLEKPVALSGRGRRRPGRRGRRRRRGVGRVLHAPVQHRDPRLAHRRARPRRLVRRRLVRRRRGLARRRHCSRAARSTRRGGGRRAACGTSGRTCSRCCGPASARSRRCTAVAGGEDVTHLVLAHESGASSTATVTLSAPAAASGNNLYVWGEAGRSVMPRHARRPGGRAAHRGRGTLACAAAGERAPAATSASAGTWSGCSPPPRPSCLIGSAPMVADISTSRFRPADI